jgi:hypothetical protein
VYQAQHLQGGGAGRVGGKQALQEDSRFCAVALLQKFAGNA